MTCVEYCSLKGVARGNVACVCRVRNAIYISWRPQVPRGLFTLGITSIFAVELIPRELFLFSVRIEAGRVPAMISSVCADL